MPAKTIKERLNEMTEEELESFFSRMLDVIQDGQKYSFPEMSDLKQLEHEIKYLTFQGFQNAR